VSTFDNEPTVVLIKRRMKALGVDLDLYIGTVTNKWDNTPRGFGFTCKDDAAYSKLMNAIVTSPKFGTDSMRGGSQHRGASFREDNRFDSLHIVLSRRPDPTMENATCSIHLDSVSPVKGIDPVSRQVIYDEGKILQHCATDLFHTPLIVPNAKDGFVLGFKF